MKKSIGRHGVVISAVIAVCLLAVVTIFASRVYQAATPVSQYRFQHIFVVVLENKDGSAVMANPYFADLAARGTRLTNYYGVSHPSQPNYIAMLAGDTLVADDSPHDLTETNLVDLVEKGGLSWKAYLEDYPGNCASAKDIGDYARSHNPFISFDNIRTNADRCARIANAIELATDIAGHHLPAVSFYVPNQSDNGHDQPLTFAAKWLQSFIDPKLQDPGFMKDTLVVVTFDESANKKSNPADVPVYTVLLGDKIHAGSIDATMYTHYSLLRTLEDNFHLGSLGRKDATAIPFNDCNFDGGCGATGAMAAPASSVSQSSAEIAGGT